MKKNLNLPVNSSGFQNSSVGSGNISLATMNNLMDNIKVKNESLATKKQSYINNNWSTSARAVPNTNLKLVNEENELMCKVESIRSSEMYSYRNQMSNRQ